MGIKKFFENVKDTLGLESSAKEGKKKSIKNLLKKLNQKKEATEKLLKSKPSKKGKNELEEELKIINCQIKNGKKVLQKLESKQIGFHIKKKFRIKTVTAFFKKVVTIWNNSDSNVKNIEVKYIGEKLFENRDIIESTLRFKRNNSHHLDFDLLVPVTVSSDIFKKIDKKDIKNIEDFLDFYVRVVSNSIVFVYNSTHPRSYLLKYKSETLGISHNIYKSNIYELKFEIYGKNEIVYLDIDDSIFFN